MQSTYSEYGTPYLATLHYTISFIKIVVLTKIHWKHAIVLLAHIQNADAEI